MAMTGDIFRDGSRTYFINIGVCAAQQLQADIDEEGARKAPFWVNLGIENRKIDYPNGDLLLKSLKDTSRQECLQKMQDEDLTKLTLISKEKDEEDRIRYVELINNEATGIMKRQEAIEEVQEIDRRNDIRQYLRDNQELEATWRKETTDPQSDEGEPPSTS